MYVHIRSYSMDLGKKNQYYKNQLFINSFINLIWSKYGYIQLGIVDVIARIS